ncbi:hypothetical protein IEQ34_020506 [Dendrobium chrysotoxum]|uniref:Uncharacterized protein n=1 Tax=Dendrobium chrysotoxum TaxID=161865 RepID=A0AAV7G179_DENCH|nr:hypothetical protein IEQ34_020506 [Dendrobium chrysotoxum]
MVEDREMATSEGSSRLLNPLDLYLKKMELELSCTTYLNNLNQPMLPPCDHTVCSSCDGLSTNDGYNYPDCRLPYESKDLRPVTHIEKFLTIYKNMSSAISSLQQRLIMTVGIKVNQWRRKLANILPQEGPNCDTKYARSNDFVESKNEQLKKCLILLSLQKY